MKIGAPKEVFPGEARVAMTPDSAVALQKLGHACFDRGGGRSRRRGSRMRLMPLPG